MTPAVPRTSDTPLERLEAAFQAALEQYYWVTGDAFEVELRLDVRPSSRFEAYVAASEGAGRLIVAESVTEAVDALWNEAFRSHGLFTLSDERLEVDRDALAHATLVWLMLHEFMHAYLGHSALYAELGLTESGAASAFGVATGPMKTEALEGALEDAEPLLIRRCLELQADDEACQLFLEPFGEGGWEQLRLRAACIFAVMVLIAKADDGVEDGDGAARTHPLASTRALMLLSHLLQMWLVSNETLRLTEQGYVADPDGAVDKEVIERFFAEVATPSVADAQCLFEAGGADALVRDLAENLADEARFFADLTKLQFDWPEDAADLATQAARELHRLHPINERLMREMGFREEEPGDA